MSGQSDELVRFLEVLDQEGCLEHVVLVGSWAEYLYQHAGLLDGFSANIRTMDIDFLVKNLRRPQPVKTLAIAAREHGYLVDSDRLTGTTKIYSPNGLEIEFLIGKRGAGEEFALKTNLGVTAQSLRHTDVLARFAVAVGFGGMAVNVPMPEAYAVHKMVINGERGRKQEKDERAVLGLWPFLDGRRTEVVLGALTKRERVRAAEFAEAHGLKLSEPRGGR